MEFCCVIIIGALSNVALASSMIAILGKIVSSLSLKKKDKSSLNNFFFVQQCSLNHTCSNLCLLSFSLKQNVFQKTNMRSFSLFFFLVFSALIKSPLVQVCIDNFFPKVGAMNYN